MEIEVFSFTKIPSLPRVVAAATIRLSDDEGESVTIEDVRILSNNRGQKYVVMPQYRMRLDSGEWDRWQPCVSLPTALHQRVQSAVLQAYQEYLREEETEHMRWLAAHSAEVRQ